MKQQSRKVLQGSHQWKLLKKIWTESKSKLLNDENLYKEDQNWKSDKIGDNEGRSDSSIENVRFAPRVSTSMVETMSVASVVMSVRGDESHNFPPNESRSSSIWELCECTEERLEFK